MSVTYLGEAARDFTIAEASRLEVQARSMMGEAGAQSAEVATIAHRLSELRDETVKVMNTALAAVEAINRRSAELQDEINRIAEIRRQLEADKAAGKPFNIEITTLP